MAYPPGWQRVHKLPDHLKGRRISSDSSGLQTESGIRIAPHTPSGAPLKGRSIKSPSYGGMKKEYPDA